MEKKLSTQFRKNNPQERLSEIEAIISQNDEAENHKPSKKEIKTFLQGDEELLKHADMMIENAIGNISVPLGVVPNLKIDDKLYHVPLATEESSVLAAANYAAKIFSRASKSSIGIKTTINPPIQIAQIALLNVDSDGEKSFNDNLSKINGMIMKHLESMHNRGGGLRSVEYRRLDIGLFIIHINIDVQDAMGANIANTCAEFIAPKIEEITRGNLLSSIVSNFSEERVVKASINLDISKIPCNGKSPDQVAQYIDYMHQWALSDIYRATTHNKGIMNAVSALALATGNDTRAIEAASHALASSISPQHYNIQYNQRSSLTPYAPLSSWIFQSHNKTLEGHITIPALFATVGGATKHPVFSWAQSLLSCNHEKPITAHILNRVAASIGLAQNFAALLALSTQGIQEGHMKLHNRKQGLSEDGDI